MLCINFEKFKNFLTLYSISHFIYHKTGIHKTEIDRHLIYNKILNTDNTIYLVQQIDGFCGGFNIFSIYSFQVNYFDMKFKEMKSHTKSQVNLINCVDEISYFAKDI